jgi:hypothetical protein
LEIERKIMASPIIETPKGKIIIDEPNMKAVLTWNPDKFSGSGAGFGGAQSWQGRYTDAQWFVDNEVLARCDKYIPFRTGMLRDSGILGTDVGSGIVQWIAPYARRQYYSPRKPGVTSPGEPLRGPFWFERMKAVSGSTIIAGARKIAGGGS